jgi:uncharacterized protein (TIGR03000 family)
MSRRFYACLGVTALAVAALLVVTEPASAQRWGWGGRGFNAGYTPWTGFSAGYGNPYYGGYGWGNYGYGWGNYPQYSGTGGNYYGWGNYPAYSGTGNYYGWRNYPATGWYAPGTQWSGNQYTGNTPSYYSEGMNQGTEGQYAGYTGGEGYGGQAYGAMSGGQMDNRVLITMRVHPNAEVWFDGQKTTETGSLRSYISPSLEPNRDFSYQVKVRWTQNGQEVDRTRKVDVHAGDRLFVNFMQPSSEGRGGATTGQYGNTDQLQGNPPAPMPHNTTTTPNVEPNTKTETPNVNPNPPPTRPTNRPANPSHGTTPQNGR